MRLEELKIISINHWNIPLEDVGLFQLAEESRIHVLHEIKSRFGLSELFYLGTCNRVELVFTRHQPLTPREKLDLLNALHRDERPFDEKIMEHVEEYEGQEAVRHLFRVSCSLESALVGEQEILTQLRLAHEFAFNAKLSGDFLRLLMRKTIEVAKRCFTQTEINAHPVSISFLTWDRLKHMGVSQDSRVLLIGAGQIINSISLFVKKAGVKHVVVANRTLSKAREIADRVGGLAIAIEELHTVDMEFDVIISCTGATDPVLTQTLYTSFVQNDSSEKIIADLAIPRDVSEEVAQLNTVHYLALDELQQESLKNKAQRQKQVGHCEAIIETSIQEFELMFMQRLVERSMSEIPQAIKDIRETAMGVVFARELEGLDQQSVELLEKIMNYMEKKYISVPMKLAREVMLKSVSKQ